MTITTMITIGVMVLLFAAVFRYKDFIQAVIKRLVVNKEDTKLVKTEHTSPLIDWVNKINGEGKYTEVTEFTQSRLVLELNYSLFQKIKDRPITFTLEVLTMDPGKGLAAKHDHIYNNSQLLFTTNVDYQRFCNGL